MICLLFEINLGILHMEIPKTVDDSIYYSPKQNFNNQNLCV